MTRFVRSILTFAVLIVLPVFVQPAAADDGRRHVMTPLQKIDLVRDLPDDPAFEKDGVHFDLGYIYAIRTVNGASVATAGESGYVLYHDDKYVRVDGALMADLRYALGDDPTQGYTPPTPSSSRARAPAADPWGANGSAVADETRGQPVVSAPVRRSSARGGSIVATLFVLFLVLFLRVRVFRDLVIGGVLAAIAGIARKSDRTDFGPGPTAPNENASTQAAAQRARLDALSGASSSNAASGGFGRKVV